MDTAALAVVVSFSSLVIASLALGWNVYRDVVLKAVVRVSIQVVVIVHDSLQERPQFVSLAATNFGPGVVTIRSILAKQTSLWLRVTRRSKMAYITPDYGNSMSGKLPAKLEVGDDVTVLLPYQADTPLLRAQFTHVGLSDSFGRVHWAPIQQVRHVNEEWRRDHGRRT